MQSVWARLPQQRGGHSGTASGHIGTYSQFYLFILSFLLSSVISFRVLVSRSQREFLHGMVWSLNVGYRADGVGAL